METAIDTRAVHKQAAIGDVSASGSSALAKYQDFFVGGRGLWSLARYELFTMVAGPMPGAPGYVLRKMLFARLLEQAGAGVQWGRNVSLRHPGKMRIGPGTAIDDHCLLDARGAGPGGFQIGCEVLIARGCLIQSKTDAGFIEIGDGCSIGGQSTLSSAGGIRLGSHVMLAGQCYVGGGRYHTERTGEPMMKQGLYSKGPVEIGDDVWVGAGARILDGVRIEQGAVVGAGAVVTKAVPAYTIVAGVPARPVGERS